MSSALSCLSGFWSGWGCVRVGVSVVAHLELLAERQSRTRGHLKFGKEN